MRLYDGQPTVDALAARMSRDRIAGDVRAIVTQTPTISTDTPYSLVISGVFDGQQLIAAYRTQRDGKILGAIAGTDTNYLMPHEFRLATDLELADLLPKATPVVKEPVRSHTRSLCPGSGLPSGYAGLRHYCSVCNKSIGPTEVTPRHFRIQYTLAKPGES